MTDLPLSVLSRGCGQFVQCEGELNGRLDVCFTPEDYYIWKAHGSLLRLSTSGCVLTGPKSTLPKTFSTRRGALLLYSQGLVTLETCPSNLYEDYGQCSVHPVQQGENTSIKLTQSILNYSGINESHHGLLTSALPALHPHPSDVEYSGTLLCQQQQHEQIQELPHSVFLAQKGGHCEDGHKKRMDVFLQMPSVTANSSQQIQHSSGSNMEAMTSEEDNNVIRNPLRTSAEQIQQEDATNISNSNNDHGKKQSNTRRSEQGGFLPPLKAAQPFKSESNKVHSERVRKSFKEQCAEHLPSIGETGAGITRGLNHKPDIKPLRKTTGPQLPFLPRLVPDKCEEKAVDLHRKHETWSCRIIQGQVSENSYNISLNTEDEYFAPFGILTGKRGPGRQSSLAFLQKLHEESGDPRNTEAARGVLPLELRDLNGRSVGSLILGPDGEIIQLSMFDNIRHSAREQALEVVSVKGEKLPWIVMLQPEHNLTDQNEEMQTIGTKQDHCFNNLIFDLERSGSGPGSVKTLSDPDAVENSDLKDSESVITRRTKRPRLAEDLVPRLSSLDGTEVETESREDKKDIRSGQLQQANMSTNKPNQMSHNNLNPDDAALQNAVRDSKKLTNKKGAEDGPISNKEKRKDTRLTPNHQAASGKERDDRITAHDSLPFSGPNNENKTPATNTNKQSKQNVALKGNETKTRDVKKANDESVNQDHVDVEDVSSEKDKKKRRGKLKYKDIQSDLLATEGTNSSQDTEEEDTKQRDIGLSSKQKHISTKSDVIEECADTDPFAVKEPRLNSDKHSRSLRSLRSGASGSSLKNSNSQKSLSSSCEGGPLQGTFQGTNAPTSLSRSRLSSCSTVTITEEGLKLNPTKSEEVVAEQSIRDQEDKATVLEAEKVKIQRQEEERKMREQEEEQRQQQQKEELEQRVRSELRNERQRRAEEIRLKKQTQEEERQRREEEEQRREQREQERREREIRRQQERKRQMEHFQRKREEEEQRRKAETDRLNLLEEKRLQEENVKLQEMTVSERAEYQRNKLEENDKREREEEERRRREEDAALLAAEKAKMEEELLAREMALLHQRLSFKRGLVVESEGLEKTQGISRPWTYSYFTLLQLLSLSTAGDRHT